MTALQFDILHRDDGSHARTGRVTTRHGSFETPAFMPVGTQAAIKGLLPQQVAALGTQIILANTYHLMLRPGSQLIAEMGGLQKWMGWDGPILTDSGGFQVFSLADINHINDDGVTFKSHLDGQTIELTPQRSMQVQNELGADIIMAFDDCPPAGEEVQGPKSKVQGPVSQSATLDLGPWTLDHARRSRAACERTVRWLDQCISAHQRADEQALFGIVQGGTDLDQRDWCIEQVCSHDLPGYAIGGVAVGEGYEQLKRVVEHVGPKLPQARPRYLMGVGYERDLVTAVRAGVDMFDCVLPTRNGRNGNAFTPTGQIRLKNAQFAHDQRPIDESCDCPACAGPGARGQGPRDEEADTDAKPHGPWPLAPGPVPPFSRSYLRHLFLAGEMLGPIHVSLHNLRHFQRLMLDIRGAIHNNDWSLIGQRWPVTVQ